MVSISKRHFITTLDSCYGARYISERKAHNVSNYALYTNIPYTRIYGSLSFWLTWIRHNAQWSMKEIQSILDKSIHTRPFFLIELDSISIYPSKIACKDNIESKSDYRFSQIIALSRIDLSRIDCPTFIESSNCFSVCPNSRRPRRLWREYGMSITAPYLELVNQLNSPKSSPCWSNC